MGTISLQIPVIGQPDTTEAPKIQNSLTAIQGAINGNIDGTNLTAAVSQAAGINVSGQTVKGSSIVPTSQSTGSTTFTTLGTPDQVTGLVLSTSGLITVWYQATWQESVANAAQAQIFLNSSTVQLTGNNGSVSFGTALVGSVGGANRNTPLSTWVAGLFSPTAQATGSVADVTTGQFIGASDTVGGTKAGGPAYIFAAAGTYTVSIQFKASSGTVTAANRRLYVQALSFA
jgi:hypothetical protein